MTRPFRETEIKRMQNDKVFCEMILNDMNDMFMVINQLLNCPDLNHDSLEDESIQAIENAQQIIGE
jgi:hypothetical protein